MKPLTRVPAWLLTLCCLATPAPSLVGWFEKHLRAR